jgi:hypothetical protein
MGCLSLAERLRTSPSISQPVKPANLVKFLTQASKELLVCWVCRSEKWAEKKAELEMLLRTEEMTTPRIMLEHWLENDDSPKQLQDTVAFWYCGERRLYLRENATTKAQQAAVAASVAEKFARNDKEATDTVYRLLGLEPADAEREKTERKWALSRSQEEWLGGLQIELQVLRLKTGKKRDRQSDGAEADGGGSGGKSEPGQQKADETSKGGEAGSTKAAGMGKGAAEATPPAQRETEAAEEKSAGAEDQTDDVEVPLKPQDTDVEFIEVSAHTRSLPRKKRGVDRQGDNRRDEKSSLGETTRKSKMELEERAMQIIRHQFETNPELSGFAITDCRKELCGYDLRAEKPGHVLRVEIKAHGREAKSVFVTKREWDESRVKDLGGQEDRWELWNVENLVGESARTKITRYGNVPEDARSQEVGYWVDLNMCSR